jgi:hypothetical protein
MAEIINLRTWKKQAARAAGKLQADGNAARFGRSKALKKLEQARADKDRSTLDLHRVENPGADAPTARDSGDAPGGR